MPIKVYSYAGCGTCKKALRWFESQQIDVRVIPIVEKPPSKSALKKLWKRSELPIKKFFNTSGKAYREGGFSERLKTMSDDEALEALTQNGMLIKRPLVDAEAAVLVGFKEEVYQQAFK
jgi:arsenate reductase